jgi:Domain of unknown function (DUF4136)
MKKKLLIPFVALLIVTAIGCSNVYKVLYTDQSPDVDFTKYKTFAWLPHDDKENTPYHNQIIENNTKNFFTHEFFVRGLTVNLDTPDVIMEMVMKTVDKQKTEQVANPSPQQNPYNNSFNNPYSNPYNNPYNYNPYNFPATSPQNPYYNPNPNQYNYNRPSNYNNAPTTYTTKIITYTESTITLNVIDRRSNKLVWTTSVAADLYDPTELRNNLHPAVHRILDRYPVKPITPKKKNDW